VQPPICTHHRSWCRILQDGAGSKLADRADRGSLQAIKKRPWIDAERLPILRGKARAYESTERGMSFNVPNKFRIRSGVLGSGDTIGNNGAFTVPRCPTWDEMCQIKALFWDDNDCIVQFHPPKAEYVNNHAYCLHLWRQIGGEFPIPDSLLVGIKEPP
jgi:hypothetical protein